MASTLQRFFQSPLRITLIAHFLATVSTGAAIAGLNYYNTAAASGSGGGGALWGGAAGSGGFFLGTFILWAMFVPLGVLCLVSFSAGLVYGRWGLPGHLQGRAVYFVPPLAAIYFAAGVWLLNIITNNSSAGSAAQQMWQMLTNSGGATLLLMYVAFSTAAVGLGWAAALAIAQYKRRHGQWETIGYVETH